MFDQVLNPLPSVFAVWLVALIPVALLLFLLAVLRMTAWLATLIGSIVTLFLGVVVWGMPLNLGLAAYVLGSLTGIWAVNWITFWGVVLFNTLVDHRHVRELPHLAGLPGHGRCPGADFAVRLGVRRLA